MRCLQLQHKISPRLSLLSPSHTRQKLSPQLRIFSCLVSQSRRVDYHHVQLHAASNTTMSLDSSYDALIIGSGQAGTPLAIAFAKAGWKTVLIESTHIAGCCVNEGCTPTKTLITSGRVAHLTRRGPDYGIHTSEGKKNNVLRSLYVPVKGARSRLRKRVFLNSSARFLRP